MTALPSHVPSGLQRSADVVSAYNKCLAVQKALQSTIDKGGNVGDNLVYIRILNIMLPEIKG